MTSYAQSLINDELNKAFGNFARSTRGNKYFKVEYKPRKKIAYFCPCCGHNAIDRVFDESLDTVLKMIESIEDISDILEKNYGTDKAETMSHSMIEGALGDIVSAFQKYAEFIFTLTIERKCFYESDCEKS